MEHVVIKYINVCMYVWMYACMHACIHVCIHVCMYVSTYARTYVHMYACTYAFMNVCTHVRTYACMYVCTANTIPAMLTNPTAIWSVNYCRIHASVQSEWIAACEWVRNNARFELRVFSKFKTPTLFDLEIQNLSTIRVFSSEISVYVCTKL